MDINIALGIAGLVLSVISLIYAIYITRKSKLEKKLVYEVLRPVPVAEVIKGASRYSLRVVYEKPDENPIYIEHAMAHYVRFSNFGKIPIVRDDIAESDGLQLEVTGGNVLAVSLASVTRTSCKIALSPITHEGESTKAKIDFEFLDHMDGGAIQILSDNKNLKTSIRGTIIGMPEGINQIEISEGTEVPNWGCAIIIFIFLISMVATPIIYKYVTGSWDFVWLLALPFIPVAIASVALLVIMLIVAPKKQLEFPKQLIPPPWYHMSRYVDARFPKPRIDRIDQENITKQK